MPATRHARPPEPSADCTRPLWSDRWFDELSVGERFATDDRVVSGADAELFSLLMGRLGVADIADHTPPARSPRATRGRLMTGLLSLLCAADLLTVPPDRVLGLARIRELTLVGTVAPRDMVRICARLTALRALDRRRGLVVCRARLVKAGAGAVALATLDLIWRRRACDHAGIADCDEDWRIAADIPV